MKNLTLPLLLLMLSTPAFTREVRLINPDALMPETARTNIDSGLILNYPFGGDANNTAGIGHNGKVFGAVLTAGKNGNTGTAYSFNGTSSYMLIDTVPEALLGNATKFIGCCIKLNAYPTSTNDMGIVYMGQDPPQNYGATHRFIINSNGKLGLNISHAFGYSKDITLPLNQWIYLFSYNEGRNFYVGIAQNGEVITEKLIWTNWGASQSNLQPGHIWIGRNVSGGTGSGNYLNGIIDELRVYNRILSKEEILELSDSSLTTAVNLNSGLLAYYPLTADAADASGNGNNGTLHGDSNFVKGVVGDAIYFEGKQTGNFVHIPENNIDTLTGITISAWINVYSFDLGCSTENEGIFALDDSNSADHCALQVYRNADDNGCGSADTLSAIGFKLIFTKSASLQTPCKYYPDNWMHVVGTYDGDTFRMYVNDTISAESISIPGLKISGNAPMWINNQYFLGNNTRGRMGGAIDELRLYNRALNGFEIDSLYRQRSINKPPVANAGADQIVESESIVTLNASASLDIDGDSLYFQWLAPEGITMHSNTAAMPEFLAPRTDQEAEYEFILFVNDSISPPSTDKVTVRVKPKIIVTKIVTLALAQAPEIGINMAKQDTTIATGSSVELGQGIAVYGGSGDYTYHWSPEASLNRTDVLNPVATPAQTTEYMLTVTDKFGCSFTVGYTVIVTDSTVGNEIAGMSSELNVMLYPNPNDGKFRVKLLARPAEHVSIFMTDAAGRMVKQQQIKNFRGEHTETFDVILPPGIYYLSVKADDQLVSRQFIIN
jgi:hypothetical protein